MRVYGLVGLLIVLSACDPVSMFMTDVSGEWQDDAAAFTVCGETLSVATDTRPRSNRR